MELAYNKFNSVLGGTFSHENNFCNVNNKSEKDSLNITNQLLLIGNVTYITL